MAIAIATIFRNINILGVSVMLVMLMVHFFIYELKNKNDYFYYYNLGFSKFQLWLSTLTIGLINLIIFAIL